MKDSLSLVCSDTQCVSDFLQWWCGNNSSCSLWFVTKHSALLYNKHNFNRVVLPADRKDQARPGWHYNYIYDVREEGGGRCAESGQQTGSHLSGENIIVSLQWVESRGLNISFQTVDLSWAEARLWLWASCWLVISLVMSHHTPHSTLLTLPVLCTHQTPGTATARQTSNWLHFPSERICKHLQKQLPRTIAVCMAMPLLCRNL